MNSYFFVLGRYQLELNKIICLLCTACYSVQALKLTRLQVESLFVMFMRSQR